MKDAWMPFGGGSRCNFPYSRHFSPAADSIAACIGLNLAKMEIRHATAKFFRTFPSAKVSALEGFKDEDMEQVIYFLMEPKGNRCLIQAS
jgi:cytochrome P450